MRLNTPGKVLLHSLAGFSLIGAAFVLTGCDAARNFLKEDREGSKEIQDYRDGLAPRLPEPATDSFSGGDSAAAIPSLQPYVAVPSTNMKAMPLVSIAINQTVPLRDALFELAEQADYDIELDPRITGSVIFTARERPFDEVVHRIADIAGLRYKFDNDVLRVEMDTPFNQTYKIDYLSYVRTNKGNVRNNIGVVSGDGADTGSAFEASTSSEADFWGELEQNLQQILGGSVSGALKTRRDPRITATEQNPDVQALAPTGEGQDGNVQQVQPPQAVLQVNSLPVEGEEEDAGAAGSTTNSTGATFTINKQAGLINVYAGEKAQKQIEAYLKLVRRAVTAQVLIEAKVLEVTLNDEYQTGVDWRALDLLSGELALNYLNSTGNAALNAIGPASSVVPTGIDANTSNLVVGYSGNDVQTLIRAVSGFGTVKALASPRMTVLNNQSAILNVATNRVFFEVDIDVSTNEGDTRVDIDSDIRNVPEGVLVNVQPSINLDNNTVALAVRPTITRIVGEESDPAVQFVTATADPPITGVQSLVPELNVQEIDSVIQVRSGQPIVMGGLLQDKASVTEEGVPVLSETPVVGSLFKQHADRVQKTELIIFLKATILDTPEESVHNTDKDLYRSFSSDRRPFKL